MKKISDLKVNQVYFLTFVNDARYAKKAKVLAIINEDSEFKDTGRTEIYFALKNGTHLAWTEEIGIGNSRKEAKSNYGKFKYEKHDSFDRSFLVVQTEIETNLKIKPFVFHRREKNN